MRPANPRPGRTALRAALFVAACVAAPAAAQADILFENFDAGIPASWTVEDYQPGGSGLTWGVSADTGMANYTGRPGFAACADSDAAGEGVEFDLALVTPLFHIPAAGGVALEFFANYQNYAGNDFADVDIDTGSGWVNLLRWNEDHGRFREAVGEFVSIPLDEFADSAARVRFHYHDPGVGDWDWYWQIDDVRVTPAPGPIVLFLAGCAVLVRGRKPRAAG